MCRILLKGYATPSCVVLLDHEAAVQAGQQALATAVLSQLRRILFKEVNLWADHACVGEKVMVGV
jgi:alpha-D-ribose 1-methylphosphonate 5-triphosphate synthase subunit PhnH